MNSDEKIDKKIASYKAKQKKEETFIENHRSALEKIKAAIEELETKKDAAIIKKFLALAKKKGINPDSLLDKLTDSLKEKEDNITSKNDDNISDKPKDDEQSLKIYKPVISDAFKQKIEKDE